jgi:hypothetical protein
LGSVDVRLTLGSNVGGGVGLVEIFHVPNLTAPGTVPTAVSTLGLVDNDDSVLFDLRSCFRAAEIYVLLRTPIAADANTPPTMQLRVLDLTDEALTIRAEFSVGVGVRFGIVVRVGDLLGIDRAVGNWIGYHG